VQKEAFFFTLSWLPRFYTFVLSSSMLWSLLAKQQQNKQKKKQTKKKQKQKKSRLAGKDFCKNRQKVLPTSATLPLLPSLQTFFVTSTMLRAHFLQK